MAVLSLVDGGELAVGLLDDHCRQWLPVGLPDGVGPHPSGGPLVGPMLVADVATDPRFVDTPAAGELAIRSFAFVPVLSGTGERLGSLAVLDRVIRDWTTGLDVLTTAARIAAGQIDLHGYTAQLTETVGSMALTEAALRENQRVLDGILSHTDALIYAKDQDGRMILVNPALDQTVAVPGGLLGRTDHDLFPAEEADVFRGNDLGIMASGERKVFDEDLTHPDGSLHSYRSTKFPLTDAVGTVYGIAGLSVDITEMAEAKRAHAEAEERWQALVERSPAGVAVVGQDGRLLYANPQALRMIGATEANELLGRQATDFLPADKRLAARARLDANLNGSAPADPVVGGTVDWQTRDGLARRTPLITLNGYSLIVEVASAVVSYGGTSALQIELRDVTDQDAAEKALVASERRFRAVFQGSPVAMAISDEDGRWVQANAAFGKLLGVDEDEVAGLTPDRFVHPDDLALLSMAQAGSLGGEDGIPRVELRFLRAGENTARWAWLTLTPTPGPNGEAWTLGMAQDVTDRVAAETALRESEADLAAIAAVARCVQSGQDPRPQVITSVRELSQASSVSMVEARDAATLTVTASTEVDLVGVQVPLAQQSMTAHVWRTGETVFVPVALDDPRVNPALVARGGMVSALWQPVIVEGEVQAILSVSWRHQVADPGDRAVHVVQVIANEAGISLHANALQRELERSAGTDPLTGVLNRRAWDVRLRALMDQAIDSGRSLTVAVVDLDHFKNYNDKYGHAAGDLMLTDFAAAARACLRKGDVFARWGGEEFTVALSDCSPEHVDRILTRVRTSVPDDRTCSIGYTTWTPGESMSTCIARADSALYQAKCRGRNQNVAA